MAYLDGFVVPVPKRNLKAYRTMAELAGKVWREHGALDSMRQGFGSTFAQLAAHLAKAG